MKKRIISALILSTISLYSNNITKTECKENKIQNVLMIQTDHELLYNYNEKNDVYKIKRPHMDKFSSEGVRFVNAKAASPVCAPARRSVITGVYPHQHGIISNQEDLECYQEVETLYDVALENNISKDDIYFFGKTHFSGDLNGSDTPQKKYGIQGWTCTGGYGNPYKSTQYKEYIKNNNYFGCSEQYLSPMMKVVDAMVPNGGPTRGSLFNLANMNIITGNIAGISVTPKEYHEAFFVADMAKKALENIANNKQDKPFMMTVNIWGPHHPYYPTEEFASLYRDKNGKLGGDIKEYPSFKDQFIDKAIVNAWDNQTNISPNYFSRSSWKSMQSYIALAYAQASLVDQACGSVIDKLDELGLGDNTIVIWTNDHGDALGSHGGHADKECYLTEEINHIGLIYRNPLLKHLAGTVSKAFVGSYDVPVTMLGAFNLKFPDEQIFGVDLYDLLTKSIEPRKYGVTETHGHFSVTTARAVYWENYVYIYYNNDIDEFYDLDKDPFELNNLVYDYHYQGIANLMKQYLREWQIKTKDIIPLVNL